MNTLTPRQYLVEISLVTLTCQPSSQVSKALCELHYGQSYTKFKTHPQITSNGIAFFKRETICVPYCNDIALVFKKSVSSKSQLFLGHYQIEVEEYLQRKIYFIETTEKLIETETYVNFQCRILDKDTFAQSETEDLSESSSVVQRSQYSLYDEDLGNTQRHSSFRDSHSEYKGSKRGTRQVSPFQKRVGEFNHKQDFSHLLQEEFSKKLYMVEQIIKKKKMLENQHAKLNSYYRNSKGELKSQKIQRLEKLMKTQKQQKIFNSLMFYVIAGLASVFLGVLMTS